MYDLVVTYLDDTKEWREEFNYYKEKEIKEHKQSESNLQAFGEERIRSWNTFKYLLRGIDKNCKWIRNVYVIMQDERQLPIWLNTDTVKVVYHKDYIKEELLPTYNTCEITMYISNIKGLSDRYLLLADDYYFLNEIPIEMYFIKNLTVQQDNQLPPILYNEKYLTGTDGTLYKILNNNFIFEKPLMGKKTKKYNILHLPEARDKRIEQIILKNYEEEIDRCFKHSKFRSQYNLTSQIFVDILKANELCIFDRKYDTYKAYCTLKSDVDFSLYEDMKVVCFNDTEQLDDFKKTKEKLITFLEKMLPDKSKYER